MIILNWNYEHNYSSPLRESRKGKKNSNSKIKNINPEFLDIYNAYSSNSLIFVFFLKD